MPIFRLTNLIWFMKYVLCIIVLGTSLIFPACTSGNRSDQQQSVPGSASDPVEQQSQSVDGGFEEQQAAVNREMRQIDEKMAANRFQDIAFEIEEGGGFIEYKRSMEGTSLKYLTVAYCSDHGCDRSSYYFSDDQLILKLDEKSHWVGNTDEIEEQRRYFGGQQEFLCMKRTAKGEGGYDSVLKQLQAMPWIEVRCGEAFDVSGIEGLKELTAENAAAYFNQ